MPAAEIAASVGSIIKAMAEANAEDKSYKKGEDIVNLIEASKSIAEKSRKSIMMYKVLVSSGIKEADVAGRIGIYLENMYSIFTLVTLGYNPMASDNKGVQSVIAGVSAESMKSHDGFHNDTEKAMSEEMLFHDFDAVKRSVARIGKHAASTETIDMNVPVIDTNNKQEDNKDADKKEPYTQRLTDIAFAKDISKFTNTYPTIVNIKLNTGSKESVSIPIAIKCNLYAVTTDEMRGIIEAGLSGKPMSYLRYIKWRSGEISTLAWLFNTDSSERDKKLYASLGRNPWYQELQMRKNANKGTFFAKLWAKITGSHSMDFTNTDAYKEVTNIAGYKGDLPPTASLIITTDDLVAASRLDLSHFTKNEGFIKKFMADSFLLCLGLVNTVKQEVSFFFLGYTNPFILSFDDLKKYDGKDTNSALADSIKELSRKV